MNDITLREFFKNLVHDLKGARENVTIPVLGTASHQKEWFEIRKKHVGKYVYLTDVYIETAPFTQIQQDLILLIADCFRQR